MPRSTEAIKVYRVLCPYGNLVRLGSHRSHQGVCVYVWEEVQLPPGWYMHTKKSRRVEGKRGALRVMAK